MFVGDGTHPLDKQFYVGRFFNIPLYFHIFLLIFLGFQLLMALVQADPLRMLWPVLLMFSVYLHELGHALSSAHFGAPPRRIVLHLFGGVAEVPGGLRHNRELWVIAWGPLVSLALAISGYVLYYLTFPSIIGSISLWMAVINTILFIFNILPIYPLDGGQWTRIWMSSRYGNSEAIRRSLPMSMVVLILAALLGLVFYDRFGPFAFVIALFLLFYNHQEWTRWRHLFQGNRGFWGYLNPFTWSSTQNQNKSNRNAPPPRGGLYARLYVWWNRKKAEQLMRKADDVGVLNLSASERLTLERYLDAKISLSTQSKNSHKYDA